MNEGFNRNNSIDTLKGLAIIAVIVIHVNAQFIVDITSSDVEYDKYALNFLIISSYLSRYCVPLFIMITGYLYWSKPNLTFKAMLYKIWTISIVFILWSMIYTLPIHTGAEDYVNLFIFGKSAPQMYYIPCIFIPVIVIMTTLRKINHSPISLIILVVVGLVIDKFDIFAGSPFVSLGYIMIYCSLGALLYYYNKNNRFQRWLMCAVLSGSIFYFLIYSLLLISDAGIQGLTTGYNYFQISILGYTLFIFCIFLINNISFKWLSVIGKYSEGLYYSHWLIYIFMYSFFISIMKGSNFWFYVYVTLIYICVLCFGMLFEIYTKYGRFNLK